MALETDMKFSKAMLLPTAYLLPLLALAWSQPAYS